MVDIRKDVFLISTEDKGCYYLTQAKQNVRGLDLMDHVCSRYFIKQVFLTEERVFCLVNLKRSVFLLKDQMYCIEFDRRSMLVVNVHKGVDQLKVSKLSSDDRVI